MSLTRIGGVFLSSMFASVIIPLLKKLNAYHCLVIVVISKYPRCFLP